MSNDEFDFRNEIDKASWVMIKDHQTRGAVFVVDKKLDLTTVADAIATDKVNLVKIWLDNGDFKKLEDEETLGFSEDPLDYIFNFIIVQPYVLIQYL